MKNPGDMKKALNVCMACTKCESCPYNGEGCSEALAADLLTYIWRLEDENARLRGEKA